MTKQEKVRDLLLFLSERPKLALFSSEQFDLLGIDPYRIHGYGSAPDQQELAERAADILAGLLTEGEREG